MSYSPRAQNLRRCRVPGCKAWAMWCLTNLGADQLCYSHATQGQKRGPYRKAPPLTREEQAARRGRMFRPTCDCGAPGLGFPHRPGSKGCSWPMPPPSGDPHRDTALAWTLSRLGGDPRGVRQEVREMREAELSRQEREEQAAQQQGWWQR